MEKSKYNRAAKDSSQLQQFVDETIDAINGETGSSSHVYEVNDITRISPETLSKLKVGDVVRKITDKQKHSYLVTYKGDGAGQGICLTYCDAGYMETVSYDRSGSSWVYNSTDVVEIPASLAQLGPVADDLLVIGKSGGLRYGYYYVDGSTNEFLFGGKEGEFIPQDYSGDSIQFLYDGIYVSTYENGNETKYVCISTIGYVEVSDDDGVAKISGAGIDMVSPVALLNLTHSFNELDPVLKQIVDDAIAGGTATSVACSEQQWIDIKQLLDKSLYINYNGYSMIKSVSNGINLYAFGVYQGEGAASSMISFSYDTSDHSLQAVYSEL